MKGGGYKCCLLSTSLTFPALLSASSPSCRLDSRTFAPIVLEALRRRKNTQPMLRSSIHASTETPTPIPIVRAFNECESVVIPPVKTTPGIDLVFFAMSDRFSVCKTLVKTPHSRPSHPPPVLHSKKDRTQCNNLPIDFFLGRIEQK
jgi:hypothetical protein